MLQLKVARLSKTKSELETYKRAMTLRRTFKIVSRKTFEDISVNLSNEQLGDCLSPRAGVVAVS